MEPFAECPAGADTGSSESAASRVGRETTYRAVAAPPNPSVRQLTARVASPLPTTVGSPFHLAWRLAARL